VTGSGTSDHSNISGPPGSRTVIAYMPADAIRSGAAGARP
jgi:hypothetical protein